MIERAQAPVLWTFGIDMKDRGDLLKELEVSKWLSEQGMGGIMYGLGRLTLLLKIANY